MKLIIKVVIIHWLASSLMYLGWHELLMRFVAGLTAAIVAVLFYFQIRQQQVE